MKSKTPFLLGLMISLTFGGAFGIFGNEEYAPDLFVLWNHAVVEGQLLSHDPAGVQVWSGQRKYQTQVGTVLVKRVLRQASGVNYAEGDTIVFSYPFGKPISEIDGLEYIGEQNSVPLNLTVGSQGLFSLQKSRRGNMPGHWFYRQYSDLPEIESFVARFEADSTKTITEFKTRHPNLRIRLELSK